MRMWRRAAAMAAASGLTCAVLQAGCSSSGSGGGGSAASGTGAGSGQGGSGASSGSGGAGGSGSTGTSGSGNAGAGAGSSGGYACPVDCVLGTWKLTKTSGDGTGCWLCEKASLVIIASKTMVAVEGENDWDWDLGGNSVLACVTTAGDGYENWKFNISTNDMTFDFSATDEYNKPCGCRFEGTQDALDPATAANCCEHFPGYPLCK